MQIPFVGFQPIRTSEHMAASGKIMLIIKLINDNQLCIEMSILSAILATSLILKLSI